MVGACTQVVDICIRHYCSSAGYRCWQFKRLYERCHADVYHRYRRDKHSREYGEFGTSCSEIYYFCSFKLRGEENQAEGKEKI